MAEIYDTRRVTVAKICMQSESRSVEFYSEQSQKERDVLARSRSRKTRQILTSQIRKIS